MTFPPSRAPACRPLTTRARACRRSSGRAPTNEATPVEAPRRCRDRSRWAKPACESRSAGRAEGRAAPDTWKRRGIRNMGHLSRKSLFFSDIRISPAWSRPPATHRFGLQIATLSGRFATVVLEVRRAAQVCLCFPSGVSHLAGGSLLQSSGRRTRIRIRRRQERVRFRDPGRNSGLSVRTHRRPSVAHVLRSGALREGCS